MENIVTAILAFRAPLIVLASLCLLFVIYRLMVGGSGNRVLYSDSGASSRVFSSSRYRLSAKPDLYEIADPGYRQIREYKSRHSGFYPSDKFQLIASAIALRDSGKPVDRGILETANGEQHIVNFHPDTSVLYDEIEPVLTQARLAVSGIEPDASPAVGKCSACSYRSICPFAKTK